MNKKVAKSDKKITILVNSCDKYEDAWEPFFKLLKINWPYCENCKIILNTEEKQYKCNFLEILTVCGGKNATWSQRLKNALDKTDTEIVLFFLEDFFLQSEVNQEMFEEALTLITNDENIGYIGLKYSPERIFADPSYIPEERFFPRDVLATSYRIVAMPVLWRKKWLVELLDESEDAWEFERNASVRSRKYSYKVLEINNINGTCPPVFVFEDKIKYGYGITHGQWLPKNKELFEKYGLEVNFDNLGINYQLYEQANNPLPETAPKSPQKKSLVEFLYETKKKFKKKIKS